MVKNEKSNCKHDDDEAFDVMVELMLQLKSKRRIADDG
jgi:hypothetical protein